MKRLKSLVNRFGNFCLNVGTVFHDTQVRALNSVTMLRNPVKDDLESGTSFIRANALHLGVLKSMFVHMKMRPQEIEAVLNVICDTRRRLIQARHLDG